MGGLDFISKALMCRHSRGAVRRGAPENRGFSSGTWALVTVDLSKLASKAKRINITLPERLLALVDAQAKRKDESRPGLLARAVLDYIGRHKVA